jgi:BlaI family transcriptional regulator, penicillinase repressor
MNRGRPVPPCAANHDRSRLTDTHSPMPPPKLTKPELRIMEALWSRGPCSVREIHQSLPAKKRLAYTTVQTMVYRLEAKKAVRRVKKIATAFIFEAAVSREAAQRKLVDDLLSLFGGRSRPIMAHLIDSGALTLDDIHEAEKTLRSHAREDRTK